MKPLPRFLKPDHSEAHVKLQSSWGCCVDHYPKSPLFASLRTPSYNPNGLHVGTIGATSLCLFMNLSAGNAKLAAKCCRSLVTSLRSSAASAVVVSSG